MNSSVSTTLKVGFTTLISLIILFGGILWIKNYNPAASKIKLSVVFDDARDIYSGDPVKLSGIKIGEVTDISLTDDNKALVKFYIHNVRLSTDTVFTIKDVGFMGDKALVVIPGKEIGNLEPDIIHIGVEGTDINSLISDAGVILGQLNSISTKIDKNLDIANLSNDFKQTLEKFQNAIAVYENLAAENREPLKNALQNIEESSKEIKKFIVKNDSKFDLTIESFQQTSEKMSAFIEDMNALPAVMDTISEYMSTNEGTFVRLLKYDDLYEEIRRTNADIDSFVIDFKRDPGKYTKDMKFKLRLF
ncbi:MlaD family protein [Candidatus Latescibacterota bacterium]